MRYFLKKKKIIQYCIVFNKNNFEYNIYSIYSSNIAIEYHLINLYIFYRK